MKLHTSEPEVRFQGWNNVVGFAGLIGVVTTWLITTSAGHDASGHGQTASYGQQNGIMCNPISIVKLLWAL